MIGDLVESTSRPTMKYLLLATTQLKGPASMRRSPGSSLPNAMMSAERFSGLKAYARWVASSSGLVSCETKPVGMPIRRKAGVPAPSTVTCARVRYASVSVVSTRYRAVSVIPFSVAR